MKTNDFKISTGVFDRYDHDTISTRTFYMVMTAFLFWGFFGTAGVAHFAIKYPFVLNFWQALVLGIGVPLLGIVMAFKSENTIISFIGYNLVVIPFGVLLCSIMYQHSPVIIRNIFGLTAGIGVFMGSIGAIFPNFFKQIERSLWLGLSALAWVGIVAISIPSLHIGGAEYLGTEIFALYIGYNMHRAYEMPKTIDNTLDVCICMYVDVYIDIINMLLNMLRSLRKSERM